MSSFYPELCNIVSLFSSVNLADKKYKNSLIFFLLQIPILFFFTQTYVISFIVAIQNFPQDMSSAHFYQYSCSVLRRSPFYIKIQAREYFPLLFYLLLPFLHVSGFTFAFSFLKCSFRNMGGTVRVVTIVLLWKEFLCFVNHLSNIEWSCPLSLRAFRPTES